MKANELFKSNSYRYAVQQRKYYGKNQITGRRGRRLYSEAIQSFGTKNPNQKDYRLIQPLNAIFCLHRQTQQKQ